MNKLTDDQVGQLARQASLEVDAEECRQLAERLNRELEMLQPLPELDLPAVEPTFCGAAHPAPRREDEVAPSLSLEQVFQNASTRDRDYFKVPQITSWEE